MPGEDNGSNEPPLRVDNPLWTFSLRVYATPGVEAECLALQDRRGADVNLVLACAWIGAERGLSLGRGEVERLREGASRWHEAAVRPLRAARRAVKPLPEMAHGKVRSFRGRLAAVELEAERIEQALLFEAAERLAPALPRGEPAAALAHNLGLLLGPDIAAEGCPALVAAALGQALTAMR